MYSSYTAASFPRKLDLAADRPEVAQRLLDDLRSRFAEAARLAGPEPVNRKDQLDQERLRALGYVE